MAEMIQKNMHTLKNSEERYRKLVETSPNATIVHQDGKIVYANPASVRLLKYSSEDELLGRHILEYVHPNSRPIVLERIKKLETNEPVDLIEEQYILSDGSVIDVEVIASPVEYMEKPAFQIIIEDISERKLAEQKLFEANELLRHLSTIDGLTEVNNRRSFDEKIEIEWLNAIQSVLEKTLDGVYRYGGEEFSVILPETDAHGARVVAEKIHKAIEHLQIPHSSSEVSTWVTVSIGIATIVPTKYSKATEIIACADKALYQAKSEGRNRIRVYS